jgi:hypothetical protein
MDSMFWSGILFGFVAGFLFYGLLKDRDNCKATTSEKDKVWSYMTKHGSITTDEAKALGIKHLRSVICRMKKDGTSIYNINSLGRKAKYRFT